MPSRSIYPTPPVVDQDAEDLVAEIESRKLSPEQLRRRQEEDRRWLRRMERPKTGLVRRFRWILGDLLEDVARLLKDR